MITFTQLIEAAESERIEISSNLVLFKKRKNAYVPYLKTESGSLTPIRGKDKRGVLVWRTYKSVDEAKEALLGEDCIKNLDLLEFKITSSSGNSSNVYKLYDWDTKQVYVEAGSFSTPHLAFMKLDALYKKDPDAYGDLGVIKFEGDDVYSINRKNGKFFKSKI